jgi:hypothetical protein
MPKSELYINGKDAFTTWGLSMDDSGLAALIAPPPMKSIVTNSSRNQHGTRYSNDAPRFDERTISLGINFKAATEAQFWQRYTSFCNDVLANGELTIATKYQPETVYRFIYTQCSQFQQYRRGLAKYVLKLTEPNPDDRAL